MVQKVNIMENTYQEIKECRGNKHALLMLIASKFESSINREKLKKEQPALWIELLKYNQVDYDLSYINIEILTNKRK